MRRPLGTTSAMFRQIIQSLQQFPELKDLGFKQNPRGVYGASYQRFEHKEFGIEISIYENLIIPESSDDYLIWITFDMDDSRISVALENATKLIPYVARIIALFDKVTSNVNRTLYAKAANLYGTGLNNPYNQSKSAEQFSVPELTFRIITRQYLPW